MKRGLLKMAVVFATVFFIFSCSQSRKENGVKSFYCRLGCMDGRTVRASMSYMEKHHEVYYPDQVDEPGIVKILADNNDPSKLAWIKEKIAVSAHHHGSKIAVIEAHPKCAGNPAPDPATDKERQILQLRKAKKTVESMGFNLKIVLLWINSDWETAEEVSDEELAEAA